MRVKCIGQAPYFTFDKIYEVDHIDDDGDVWVKDDQGDSMFLYPYECEVVE